ncbi:MAG: hypothetical protein MK211_08735 [Flavobacteriales bacterium]|nr:hypothetical protein [Flavobacteriales bacterium]
MKKLAVTLLLTIIGATGYAQTNLGSGAYSLYEREVNINNTNEFFNLSEEEFKNIEGSPYSNDTFLKGNIYQDDKLIMKDVPMRYNSYSDEIEMKKNENEENYGALLKSPDLFVKIFNDVYIFVPKNGSTEEGGYFKILSPNDHYDLYKKTTTTFSQPYEARTTYEQNRPAKFSSTHTYYLVSKRDGKFVELPTSRSKALKVMSVKKKEVKKFMNDRRIDVSEEADLIKLVSYFNSIL